MGAQTGIEWTDHTFNPWIGCTAISPACDHCYAKTLVERWGGDFEQRRRTAPSNWLKPLAWDRAAAKAGVRRRVFCASLADVFDNQVPEQWRADLWDLIRVTPHLDWQLLTKRPQNIAKMLPADWGAGWKNVWLGTTTENQEEYDRRWPHLKCVPAVIRFISYEPAIGPLRLPMRTLGVYGEEWPDWVICGGESGPGARPMHPQWASDIRDQCAAADVPFFFKQNGEWLHDNQLGWFFFDDDWIKSRPYVDRFWRVGNKASGSLLDGIAHKAFPSWSWRMAKSPINHEVHP